MTTPAPLNPKSASTSRPSSGSWRFALFNLLAYTAFSLFTIYGSLYFRRRGLSNMQLGLLNAIPAWVGIFSPLVWGLMSDALKQRRLPNALTHIGPALIFPLFWFWKGSFGALCLIMAAFTFFFSASSALADAWALDHIQRRGGDYGRLRSWGSLGFILPIFAFSAVMKSSESSTAQDLWPIFAGFCGLRVLSGLYAMSLPDYQAQGPPVRLQWQSLRVYLHPFALTFLLSIFLNRFASGPYYAYFSVFLDEQGVPDRLIGYFWVVAVAAETGLIACSGALIRRVGTVPLLLSGILAMSFRVYVFSLEPAWGVLLAVQTLHAFTFGAFHVASVAIFNRITPPSFRATGQTLNGAVTGLGGVAGCLVGGHLAQSLGLPGLFRALSLLALLSGACVALFFALFRSPAQEAQEA